MTLSFEGIVAALTLAVQLTALFYGYDRGNADRFRSERVSLTLILMEHNIDPVHRHCRVDEGAVLPLDCDRFRGSPHRSPPLLGVCQNNLPVCAGSFLICWHFIAFFMVANDNIATQHSSLGGFHRCAFSQEFRMVRMAMLRPSSDPGV